MKVLVLGGGGFIGTAVSLRLLSDGHAVTVFNRTEPPLGHPLAARRAAWVTGEFSDGTDFGAMLAGVDAVVHLVSTTVPKSSMDDPVADARSNLCGTLHFMQQAVAAGVRKVVFISSGGTVYGRSQYLPIDERHPTEPQVAYGIVKLAIEKYLRMYSEMYGISATVLRVANPYGEWQGQHAGQGALGAFIRNALAGRPIDIWGDGSVVRDYLYVGDVATAFARALEHPAPYAVFNIGSGIGLSINEVADGIEQALGLRITRNYLPSRAIDVPANVLDRSLAARELGWEPVVPLAEGIQRTAAWLQEQR
jgi:UDP-glucose 4-epimerase